MRVSTTRCWNGLSQVQGLPPLSFYPRARGCFPPLAASPSSVCPACPSGVLQWQEELQLSWAHVADGYT